MVKQSSLKLLSNHNIKQCLIILFIYEERNDKILCLIPIHPVITVFISTLKATKLLWFTVFLPFQMCKSTPNPNRYPEDSHLLHLLTSLLSWTLDNARYDMILNYNTAWFIRLLYPQTSSHLFFIGLQKLRLSWGNLLRWSVFQEAGFLLGRLQDRQHSRVLWVLQTCPAKLPWMGPEVWETGQNCHHVQRQSVRRDPGPGRVETSHWSLFSNYCALIGWDHCWCYASSLIYVIKNQLKAAY